MYHHAYLYEGPVSDFPTVAEAARTMLGLPDTASPDVVERQYDKFGIDDSRELIQFASLRGAGERSLIVIGIASVTTEAQQALLKLLEEPREGLTFVILVPHGVILPTLRSRMMAFDIKNKIASSKNGNPAAIKFLAALPKERSEMLAKILKTDDAKEQLRTLLNDIEAHVYTSVHTDVRTKDKADLIRALSEIAAIRPYLSDRSPSLKMIGEHLAAVLPQL